MHPGKREIEQRAVRQAVYEHAKARHGIFQRSDLEALGIDPSSIRTFMRKGWWTRLHHGIYIDTDVLVAATDPVTRVRIQSSAAIAALLEPAFTFGPTSAMLHGLALDRSLTKGTSLVRPYGTDQRALHRRIRQISSLTDVTVHRHAIPDAQLTIIDGIPTVDIVNAAISTAARSELMWAIATLDSLLWRDAQAVGPLLDRIDDWSGLRGIGTVRQAALLTRPGAQNPLESISRFRVTQANLPEPILQMPVYDADGLIGYVDMAWPDVKVIGEADGLHKYQDRADLIAEKIREDRLRAEGWIVVRWTWDEILRTPHVVIARIRRAMKAAARRVA